MNARLGTWSPVFLGFAILAGACSAAESEGTIDPAGSNTLAPSGGQVGASTGGLGTISEGTGGIYVPPTGNGGSATSGGSTAAGGSEEGTGGTPAASSCPTFKPNNAAYCSADLLELECGPYPSGETCTCVASGLAGAWECVGD
jgi:hypothetical protein